MLCKYFFPVCGFFFPISYQSLEEQDDSGGTKMRLDALCILKAQDMLMNWMWNVREREVSRMTSRFLTEQLKGWSC